MTDEGPVQAQVTIADYAAVDAIGKVNVVGGGVSLIGFNPETNTTAPFSVWVSLTHTDDGSIHESAVEVSLLDGTKDLVQLPTPLGTTQPFRLARVVQFRPPGPPDMVLPRGVVRSPSNIIFNFGSGLQLHAGEAYEWVVRADSHQIASSPFYIVGAPPPPAVFG